MKVFRTYAEVEPYIVACQLGADAHRDALGFLPVGAYQQAAQQGKLLVAATDDRKFLGHLLFGGVFPHLKVMQIFCDEKHRNRGVSTKLINELFSYATERGFLSISAKVASDLVGAKRFYESVGFREASYLKGGKTRNRTICRFVKELDTPSLFDFLENSASGAVPSLNLAGAYKNKTPIYAIDLNVLFDFSKGRQRKKEAEALFRAGLRGEICPVITEEFSIELSRNSYGLEDDIIYKFSKLFSSIPSYGSKKTNEIRENLLRIVFGERYVSGRNTKQDYSDVNHLAQSILNNVDGFVTSEKSILRKRDDIKEIYGLDIIGLSDFEDLYDEGLIYDEPSKSININSGRLNIKSIDWDDCKGVREFLSGMNIPNQVVEDNISRENCLSSRKLWAWEKDGAIIGIYSIRSHGGPNSFFDSFICVDEAFPDSNTVIDCILNSICMFAGRSGPSLIELNIVPGHYSTRQACLAYGFRPEAGADKFAKKIS
jgi:ribosomal protein S18 acetylase RimI-like enzyme